jgi:hypothetical protein
MSVLGTYSKVRPDSLRDNGFVEIFNKIGDRGSERSIFSDNEIDGVPVSGAIINDDSNEEGKTCITLLKEGMDNYSGHTELLSEYIGPINDAKIIRNVFYTFQRFQFLLFAR